MTESRSKYRKLKQVKGHNLPLPSEEANKNYIVELVGEALARRPIPQQGQRSKSWPSIFRSVSRAEAGFGGQKDVAVSFLHKFILADLSRGAKMPKWRIAKPWWQDTEHKAADKLSGR